MHPLLQVAAANLPPKNTQIALQYSSLTNSEAATTTLTSNATRNNAPINTTAARKPSSAALLSDGWFQLQATVPDREQQLLLQLIANRHALDPKRHYRRIKLNSDWIQVGTLLGDASDISTKSLLSNKWIKTRNQQLCLAAQQRARAPKRKTKSRK